MEDLAQRLSARGAWRESPKAAKHREAAEHQRHSDSAECQASGCWRGQGLKQQWTGVTVGWSGRGLEQSRTRAVIRCGGRSLETTSAGESSGGEADHKSGASE